MSFTSLEFYIFFAVVFFIYALLPHKPQNILLVLASFFFYAYWDWRFCSLLIVLIVTDYFCALAIENNNEVRKKRIYLLISITTNLSILGIFKYMNFFISQFEQIFLSFGFHPSLLALRIIFPLGISFYTFQSLGYTIDVYRGYSKPAKSFLDYSLFVSFFPLLVAGPIERADHLLPQIQAKRVIVFQNIKLGLHLIYWGLFKKIFVADTCAIISDNILLHFNNYSGAEILVGMYAFAFRMYGDISGYTDIARGTAKCLGFDLAINFRLPYFATNVSEFWRRWHISVTSWFRDYVFSPILFATKGNSYLSSFVTLFCIAIWHSLSLNSIIRGCYFGFMVIIYYVIRNNAGIFNFKNDKVWIKKAMSVFFGIVTFHIVCLGWLFLLNIETSRIPQLAWRVLSNFDTGVFITNFVWLFKYVWLLFAVQVLQAVKKDEFFILRSNFVFQAVFYVAIFMLLYGVNNGVIIRPFIYLKY